MSLRNIQRLIDKGKRINSSSKIKYESSKESLVERLLNLTSISLMNFFFYSKEVNQDKLNHLEEDDKKQKHQQRKHCIFISAKDLLFHSELSKSSAKIIQKFYRQYLKSFSLSLQTTKIYLQSYQMEQQKKKKNQLKNVYHDILNHPHIIPSSSYISPLIEHKIDIYMEMEIETLQEE